MIALPITISTRGIGPRIEVTHEIGPAVASATRWECWRPRVRGATPITTNETSAMMPIEVTSERQNAPS